MADWAVSKQIVKLTIHALHRALGSRACLASAPFEMPITGHAEIRFA